MENKYLNSLGELDYASLEDKQDGKLKEMEKQFNNEFGTDYYFMVMKKRNK